MKRIALVEDEISLNTILSRYLEKEGYQVDSFTNGLDAYNAIDKTFDLWVLDIMVPMMDGFELIKEIKSRFPSIPVIFISARNQDIDRVIGLELGSDDYISKPFLPRELVLRVNRLIQNRAPLSVAHAIELGPYNICIEQRTVREGRSAIELTSKEFDLLLLLSQNLRQSFSREDILLKIWGADYFGSDRVVDDTIRRIRKKLPEIGIETIYGYGYRMVTS
ncbi:MAG: response regulator transcription factor [Clostridia bacterium]|nr:response regulator transcription factor [Clostridia bacterium]